MTYTKATIWLTNLINGLKDTMKQHENILNDHSIRMNRFEQSLDVRMRLYEERYLIMAGHLQRVIGQMNIDIDKFKD